MKNEDSDTRVPRRCEKLAVLYSEYVDGELDQAAREQVEDHLKSCAPCRLDIALMREITRNLLQIEEEAVPEDFAARVALSAASRQQPKQLTLLESITNIFRVRTLVAVGAMAVVAALVLLPQSGLIQTVPGGDFLAQGGLVAPRMEVQAGQVTVAGRAVSQPLALQSEMPIRGGQGAKAVLRFATDTRVEFGEGAQLACVAEGIRVDAGLVAVAVPKKPVAAGKPSFRVFTPNARVSVWGTRFTVLYDGKSTRVECTRGVVGVERMAAGKVVTAERRITANQGAIVGGTGEVWIEKLKGRPTEAIGPASTSEDTTIQLSPGAVLHVPTGGK